jgi:phosphoribosylformylglycinamidine synthase subunit PurSL
MLWEVEIRPADGEANREAARVKAECVGLKLETISSVDAAHSFLLQGELSADEVDRVSSILLADPVAETYSARRIDSTSEESDQRNVSQKLLNVLFLPGVTDNVAISAAKALRQNNADVTGVATCRKYWINGDANGDEIKRLATKVLSNHNIELVKEDQLKMNNLFDGEPYEFKLEHEPILEQTDAELKAISERMQLSLNLEEMKTIQAYFATKEKREPRNIELESVAQTWSEHCSHKTLAGRVDYTDEKQHRFFENMLKETIFEATVEIRRRLAGEDWCISVFKDNAGIVTFDEKQHVAFKVETHNHPSALEPYGGANTGIGGVIRDPLGTGLGARPVCNTDVFCFAPPDTAHEDLPQGILHPKTIAQGVVAGVRDYGNRMGIPTVNGAVFFDKRYLGNPLVYCGNVAMIPVDKCDKEVKDGDFIVTVGGKTGRDGIHGATFSSVDIDQNTEVVSAGAVQIGDAVTEKIVMDVILEARDQGLYRAITDCGAGGFSSAVGEMAEESGAEVWLDQAPLKYSGLSYTEIWISEAQERMVLAVPPKDWDAFEALCKSEDVDTARIGKFTDTKRLVLKYGDHEVCNLAMSFLHDGRPPIVREATFTPAAVKPINAPQRDDYTEDLLKILGSLNVCSKEWIIRQYDHEVQSGSVVKPLVGVQCDGPSDAAVVRPDLESNRGLVVSNGMNPHYGDLDPYWMAASAIDEALRNCVAVGADPSRIAILDNFCWGNPEDPQVLGSLVRAALACYDFALTFKTPFISGKDSLYNEYKNTDDNTRVVIPGSLLISALGQIDSVEQAVTMDLKSAGNKLFLIGVTKDELGGSHFGLVNDLSGGQVPNVDAELAPKIFNAVHRSISAELLESCHDLSEGGLAVAAAEMAFAGEFGLDLDLGRVATATGISDSSTLLFSESNTRFLVEIAPENVAAVESEFADLPIIELGNVTDSNRVIIKHGSATPVDSSWSDLKAAWQKTLDW